MRWFLRLLGFALALGLAISAAGTVPLDKHDGITPIHCTLIDAAVMGVGFFFLFWIPIAMLIERIAIEQITFARRDTRIPTARVVR